MWWVYTGGRLIDHLAILSEYFIGFELSFVLQLMAVAWVAPDYNLFVHRVKILALRSEGLWRHGLEFVLGLLLDKVRKPISGVEHGALFLSFLKGPLLTNKLGRLIAIILYTYGFT